MTAENVDQGSPAVSNGEQASDTASHAIARLLRLGDGYRRVNDSHQALEMYFWILEDHSQAPEAPKAAERLMEMAGEYERSGKPHEARAIYERLL